MLQILILNAFLISSAIAASGSWRNNQYLDKSWYQSSKKEFSISSARELAGLIALSEETDFSGVTIKLQANVDLGEHIWEPIGLTNKFNGIFDGNNKTISNIYVDGSDLDSGFFSSVSGTVKNLKINGSIRTDCVPPSGKVSSCGCIVGYCNDCTIENCHSDCEVTDAYYCGGIAGFVYGGEINQCSNKGNIYSDQVGSGIGGIAGNGDNLKLRNSYNIGSVSKGSCSGGLVGYSLRGGFEILNCYNVGSVSGTETAGVIGSSRNMECGGDVKNTYSYTDCKYQFGVHVCVEYCYGKSENLVYFGAYKTTAKYCGIIDENGGVTKSAYKKDGLGYYSQSNTEKIINRETELYGALNAWIDEQSNPNDYERWAPGNSEIPAVFSSRVSVTFDSNGGTKVTSPVIKYTGSVYGSLPQPSRTGYVFIGWYTSSVGGEKINEDDIVMQTADHTLYAQWKKQITISFNLNGGSGSISSRSLFSGDQYGTLPIPTRSGFEFAGWFTSSTNGDLVNENTIAGESSVTLYAHWIQLFTVTLDASGGAFTDGKQQQQLIVKNGEKYSNLPDPEKEGNKFIGWFTEKTDGTHILSSSTVNLTDDITLYAHWEKCTYKLTYVTNNKSNNIVKSYQFGDDIDLTPPEYEGFKFAGWFVDEECKNKFEGSTMPARSFTLYAKWGKSISVTLVSQGVVIDTLDRVSGGEYGNLPNPEKAGYKFVGWFDKEQGGNQFFSSSSVKDVDHTLYARFTALVFNIIFETNGGTGIDKISFECDSKIVLPSQPHRDGYKFLGWYIDEGLSEAFSDTAMPPHDLTLYARWGKTYEVIFDSQGGIPSVTVKEYMYNEKYGELPTPLKEGHILVGWYCNDVEVTDETMHLSTSSQTVVARWERGKYSIVFNTNGGSVVPSMTEIPFETVLTIPTNVEKKEYIFDGWFLDSSFTQPFSLTKMPGHDLFLYAKWIKESDAKEESDKLEKTEVIISIVCGVIAVIGAGYAILAYFKLIPESVNLITRCKKNKSANNSTPLTSVSTNNP